MAARSSAYAAARSSFQRYGSTAMPRSTATQSVVVKDSTSTTTATSAPSAIAAAPVGPQSKRTRSDGPALGRLRKPYGVQSRTRTTDLPRVLRWSMSTSA